jgi:hypothetical protein
LQHLADLLDAPVVDGGAGVPVAVERDGLLGVVVAEAALERDDLQRAAGLDAQRVVRVDGALAVVAARVVAAGGDAPGERGAGQARDPSTVRLRG